MIPLPRLVRPQVLSRLKRSSILALLHPFSGYLATRGVSLPALADENEPLAPLISVLASPTGSTPSDLIERLEMLDVIRFSVPTFEDCYGDLVARLMEKDDTAADMAVKILIHAPQVAWRELDRQALLAPRSSVAFTVSGGLPFHTLDDSLVKRFESLAGPWFEANARSPVCRLHPRIEGGTVSFVIRHGDLLKRIGVCEEDGRTGSRILRPERVDVARYNPATRGWEISGMGARVQELYRKLFGTVFHGSPSALVHSKRYSLEPLREGPDSLVCDPSSNVQFAQLVSLRIRLGRGNEVTLWNGDIFGAFDDLGPTLLSTAELVEARIDLKLANRRRRQKVILCPHRDKVSGLQTDPAIEPWLAQHGFSNPVADDRFVLESN